MPTPSPVLDAMDTLMTTTKRHVLRRKPEPALTPRPGQTKPLRRPLRTKREQDGDREY
jgi:hypothetical protein